MAYKEGSGLEHGIYQTFKLALYPYTLQATGSYYYGRGTESLPVTGS